MQILVIAILISITSFVENSAAEPLAKSGKVTIHSGYKGDGTTTQIGDNRMYWSGTYWGVSFNDTGKGFLHNVAWNCPAISDINSGMIQTKGYCTLTDTDGDKNNGDWVGKGTVGAESKGRFDVNGGTGKYMGIKGGWDFQCKSVGSDGQLYCQQQVAYTLP
jgi:hypothetical protein